MFKNTPVTLLSILFVVALVSVLGVSPVRKDSTSRPSMISRVMPLTPEGERRLMNAIELRRRAGRLPRIKANLPRIVEQYRQAYEARPDPFVRLELAKALFENGQLDEARPLFREYFSKLKSQEIWRVSNDPDETLQTAQYAARLGLEGDSEALVAGFADGPIHQIDARFRLPELDHDLAHARSNGLFAAGICELRVHRNAEAVPLFEEAVRERPDWGTARFMLAYAHAYAGHRAEADKGFADAARFGWKRPRGL